MRNARGWAVAGLVAAMTAGGAAPARASAGPCPQGGQEGNPSTSVSYRFGDITEAVLRVPVSVASVRHLVPSRYRLLDEATGTTTLLAAHGSVAALRVGCSSDEPATVSEYGVMVESPDGEPGRHAYYLALLTDDRRLVARLRMLGAPVEFARGRFDVVSDSAGNVRVAAEEVWKDGAVELAATATEPASGPLVTGSGVRFWFDGPRGTVRNAYECPDCRPRTPARGTVLGSGGSAVETILGGARATGSGFFIRTTLLATARLVD